MKRFKLRAAVLVFAGLAALTVEWIRSGGMGRSESVPVEDAMPQPDELVMAPVAATPLAEAETPSAETEADVPDAPDAPDLPRLFRLTREAQRRDGSFAVQWDHARVQALRPGDVFAIDMPGGDEPHTAQVAGEESFDGGRRLSGRMHDGGIGSWPFSLTLSSDGYTVVGNLTTAIGHFSVDADANGGRLRSAAEEEWQNEESEGSGHPE
nr:hypothetical protein [uncultured Cupriavidus sp.]